MAAGRAGGGPAPSPAHRLRARMASRRRSRDRAEGPGVAWHTANDAVLAEGKRALIDHPDRLDGVTAIGVDEHARRRTERGGPCAPVQIPSPRSSRTGSRRCSPPRPHRGRDDMVDPPADDRGPPARRSPPGTRIDGQADNSISSGAPKSSAEIIAPGRTLKNRAVDAPARFDRSGASNGPTEAINGRLEHLRGSALGFRNVTNCIARSLLETGGFRPRPHPRLRIA